MLRFLIMSMLSSSNKLQRWWLVRTPFPESERKVDCKIIPLQDLRASKLLILIVSVCQVYHGPSNLLRCWFRHEG